MNEFVGFSYYLNGRVWVEAIPTHNVPVCLGMKNLPEYVKWYIIYAPSVNQARKRVYELSINLAGKGFNHFPRSRYSKRRFSNA